MARHVVCMVLGHQVNRRRIRREGQIYVGRCRWCRTRMWRAEDGWEEGVPQDPMHLDEGGSHFHKA